MRSYACIALAISCALLLGNAIAAGQPVGKVSYSNTVVRRLMPVPLTRQATNYTCGVAALQSVLAYYGEDVREDTLAKILKADPQEGTKYSEIERYAKGKGYKVDVQLGLSLDRLKQLLDARKPVICLIQAWPEKTVNFAKDWDDGHYVVAVGYDRKNIYFMDPSTIGNYTYIPAGEFVERWHDRETVRRLVHFGMVITKPSPVYKPSAIKKLE